MFKLTFYYIIPLQISSIKDNILLNEYIIDKREDHNMKPNYKMTLGEFIRYNHVYYTDWYLKIYVDDVLKFDSSIQNAYTFGNDFLNVIEWFRNNTSKTIKIYTENEL